MKSTVASGPIPPMIPTTFSLARIAISDVAGQLELVGIAKQPGRPACVQEHHVAILGEQALADLVDQAIHALAAVDRIQKDTLGPRDQLERFAHSLCGKSVAGADIVAICRHMMA